MEGESDESRLETLHTAVSQGVCGKLLQHKPTKTLTEALMWLRIQREISLI